MRTLAEINARLNQIEAELRRENITAEELAALETESNALIEERKTILDANERREAQLRRIAEGAGQVVRTFTPNPTLAPEARGGARADIAEISSSPEYRRAFMNYVQRGARMPAELRVNETTYTTDVGVMIPEPVLNRIIERIEARGMILSRVARSAYKGGLTIPTSTAKPVATWVREGAGSDTQKKTTGSISFSYHKLRCAVSMTLETEVMALSAFEASLVKGVADGMLKALEQAIISGSGDGQPRGILIETPLEGHELFADSLDYEALIAMEAELPMEYETGAVWLMTKKTFMTFESMSDASGQPIARTNFGISRAPERYLLGREVVLNNYMPSFPTAEANEIVAAIVDLSDYLLNTNLQMTIKHYEDNENEDKVTKAIMLVDGKMLQLDSLVTLKKTPPNFE